MNMNEVNPLEGQIGDSKEPLMATGRVGIAVFKDILPIGIAFVSVPG